MFTLCEHNTHVSQCKICGYKKRNKEKYEAVLSEGFWSETELNIVIAEVLVNGTTVINHIIPLLNQKTLSDLAKLLYYDMPIRGRGVCHVMLPCFSCGKILEKPLNAYFKPRVYCSLKCRDEYKSNFLKGENSPFYNRIQAKCSFCQKDMLIIPHDAKLKNQFGDEHHFCSRECYSQFRSEYYSGTKHPQYHIEWTEERRAKIAVSTVKQIQDGKFKQTQTKPHRIVNRLLEQNGITYENEKAIGHYSVDVYLPESNLLIEVMGDFWHCSPIKYTQDSLYDIQKKSIRRDKAKHTYVRKYHNVEILYLWENDIMQNEALCEQLILLYIKNHGMLQNYHSFNYHLCHDTHKLKMNTHIITPFFDIETLTTAG